MPVLDVAASVAALDRQDAGGAVKIREDLDRYEAVIARAHPEAVIECGTWEGRSALWFAEHGLDVVTIDTDHGRVAGEARNHEWITLLRGDSASREMRNRAARVVSGRRVMVVLDSSHDAAHVRREIELYGPVVTPGCHLVVEDGIIRWIPSPFRQGFTGPLDAIEEMLTGDARWERDTAVEDMHPVTMSPMGWWIRRA